ncbi:hypothetical protein SynA18461_00566 [Synechococcus sp. A18-46.1]|nr:hypothetical protein SynA18461_00566 [Synechococcus sp. A18-46.1]
MIPRQLTPNKNIGPLSIQKICNKTFIERQSNVHHVSYKESPRTYDKAKFSEADLIYMK